VADVQGLVGIGLRILDKDFFLPGGLNQGIRSSIKESARENVRAKRGARRFESTEKIQISGNGAYLGDGSVFGRPKASLEFVSNFGRCEPGLLRQGMAGKGGMAEMKLGRNGDEGEQPTEFFLRNRGSALGHPPLKRGRNRVVNGFKE
jgi:hypothetical protein